MRTYAYDEPNKDGSNNHVRMTEQEIFDSYWEYWSDQMLKAVHNKNTTAYLKPEMLNWEKCLEDWITVHWAYEIK